VPVVVLPLRCVDASGRRGGLSFHWQQSGTQPCTESGQAAMVLDSLQATGHSWLATAAIQGRWRPPDAPRAKEAWRAVGLPDANPWALGGLASSASLAEVGWSTGAAQQRAPGLARWPSCRMIRIRAWAFWLQCILLDESITALLHDSSRKFPLGLPPRA
jgi:hypothetical protein